MNISQILTIFVPQGLKLMMRKTTLIALALIPLLVSSRTLPLRVQPSASDLRFPDLATVWDEAMPLGNATLGALVWQRWDMSRGKWSNVLMRIDNEERVYC